MTGRDDDALSWAGDDDPTLDAGIARDADAPPAALPKGFTALGKGSEDVGLVDPDGTVTMPGERDSMGNGSLIALGVFGGIYLLYAVGWLIGGLRLGGTAQFLVSPLAYLFGLWLAVLAPLVWFVTVLAVARNARGWVRVVWLVAGALLLIPWPFIMTGAVGQ